MKRAGLRDVSNNTAKVPKAGVKAKAKNAPKNPVGRPRKSTGKASSIPADVVKRKKDDVPAPDPVPTTSAVEQNRARQEAEKQRQELQKAELKRQQEAELKRQQDLQRQQELQREQELQKQREELQKQRQEEIQRQKDEIERKQEEILRLERQQEVQRLQEAQRQSQISQLSQQSQISQLSQISQASQFSSQASQEQPSQQSTQQGSQAAEDPDFPQLSRISIPANLLQDKITNPQECVDYSEDIYSHLVKMENDPDLYVRNPNYLDGQKEVRPRMRAILLDWLLEVHYKFKLRPDTFYLTVSLIDRVLNKKQDMERKKLQLLGGTSLLVAAKFEEMMPPEISDIVYIMDNAYTRDEILDMETLILNHLRFRFALPNILYFINFYRADLGFGTRDFFMAQYFAEATLLELHFLRYKPSQIAAACVYLVNRVRRTSTPWPQRMVERTKLEEVTIVKPLAKEIFEIIPNFRQKALFKKYSLDKFENIAPMVPLQ